MELTQEKLKEYLEYNPDTGNFTWIKKKGSRTNVGEVAGGICKTHGYIFIRFNGVNYRAHRLIYLYFNGYFPEKEIDHINHNRSDNRFLNLREVSHKENNKNSTLKFNNKSGVCGVVWVKKRNRWLSRITVDGESIHLGSFVNFHEAVNIRKNAEVLYGFHKNHGT